MKFLMKKKKINKISESQDSHQLITPSGVSAAPSHNAASLYEWASRNLSIKNIFLATL